jgi:hypothetical protein
MRVRAIGWRPIAVPAYAAVHEREVFALHAPRGELAHEVGLRLRRPRHDEQAARVLVEAVHDPGAGDLREPRRVVQERVHQRAPPVPGPGMDHQPGRLVDDQERVVLVHDRQGDRFGLAAGIGRRSLVDGDAALAHPQLEAAAGMLREHARERLVEPQSREPRRDLAHRRGAIIPHVAISPARHDNHAS